VTAALALMLLVAEPPAATAQARELGQQAQKLYKQGKYLEAIEKYEAAYALKPHPAVHFNIAKCREALGEPAKALSEYREYLRLMPDASDRPIVDASMGTLRAQLAQRGVQQLAVYATPASAVIEIDGKTLGIPPVYVELPPGQHTVVVSAADFDRVEKSVTLTLERVEDVNVELKLHHAATSAGAPPPPEPKAQATAAPEDEPLRLTTMPVEAPRRVWTWVAAGFGIAAAVSGIICGVTANGAASTLHGDPHVTTDADALVSQASTFALGANVSWSVAAAALLIAVVAFIVEGRP
jgi:tetratricopeptide (TPR) repeat protein